MPEVVRSVKKQGAKNREINSSIKDVMATIMENREKAEKERLAKYQKKETEELSNE